jgi:hypothetical protein
MDELLFAQIRDKLGGDLEKTTLFTLKSKFNSRLNVVLIKFLVNERGMKGICVSVDRPSFYMRKILEKNGVDMDKVIFLDAMKNISGDCRSKDYDPHIVCNPFPGEMLGGVKEEGFGTKRFEGVDFVIIDNATVLSCYIDNDSIVCLLEALCGMTDVHAILSVDKETNKDMYERLKQVCTSEYEIVDEGTLILRKKIVG